MEKKNKLIRLLAASVSSIMIAILGVLYIISCIGIWRSGSSPFTRESIGDALMKLIVPSAITVALIIVSAVLFILFPVKEKKKKPTDKKDVRGILAETIKLSECKTERAEAIIKEGNKRFVLRAVGVLILLFSLIYPIIYLLTPDNFGVTDVNTDVLLAAMHIILSFIPLTAYCIVSSYVINTSYAKEIEILRIAIKEHSTGDVNGLYCAESSDVKPFSAIFDRISTFFKKNNKVILTVTRCTVLLVGVVFVVVGILNGGMQDVLDKAVKICRECIGLG